MFDELLAAIDALVDFATANDYKPLAPPDRAEFERLDAEVGARCQVARVSIPAVSPSRDLRPFGLTCIPSFATPNGFHVCPSHNWFQAMRALQRTVELRKPKVGKDGAGQGEGADAGRDPARPEAEGGTPPAGPFVPLTSWNDILAALNEPHGKPVWKNDERTRKTIRKLNGQHNGPICLPSGKGKQPSVDKAALLTWWKGLQAHFDARTDEGAAEAESARSTVDDSHKYGAYGTVVPGIGGSVKKTRAKGGEKGKETKR